MELVVSTALKLHQKRVKGSPEEDGKGAGVGEVRAVLSFDF